MRHHTHPQPTLLSKVVRCGLDIKIARMRQTMTYFSFWLFIVRPQSTYYRAKLSEVGAKNAATCRLAELANCLLLNLTYTLTCEVELLANLLEGHL